MASPQIDWTDVAAEYQAIIAELTSSLAMARASAKRLEVALAEATRVPSPAPASDHTGDHDSE